MADTFNYIPDQGATPTMKARSNKSQFGDGYQQRSTYGLNAITELWALSFSLRPLTTVTAMNNFFKAHNGTTSFWWAMPTGELGLFICTDWQPTFNGPFDSVMQCTLERVYESA